MVAIEVRLLTGRYIATSHHDREQPEWPPHGARLFSAMVAAWAEAEPPDDRERSALEWLESLPPPRIAASQADPRRVVSHFVPVNDVAVVSQHRYRERARQLEDLLGEFDGVIAAARGEMTTKADEIQTRIDKVRDVAIFAGRVGTATPDSAAELLPDGRSKKERFFPSVTPLEPVVTYSWSMDPTPEALEVLGGLLERVTRLGHSSSMVSCRLVRDEPEATHIPGSGTMMLRWVQPGQTLALEEAHQRHQAIRQRSLPFVGSRYDTVDLGVPGESRPTRRPNTAGDWIVFELEASDRKIPTTRAVELARVLRDAVLHHAPDPIPEGLSGHVGNGRPTSSPHVAFLALPNVGSEYSDGRIMGLAISLPAELDDDARTTALRAVGAWERRAGSRPLRLTLGQRGVIEMRRRQGPFALVALRPNVWRRRSRRWASATPVALPNHPGDLRGGSPHARAQAWKRAEEAALRACGHVDLPRPVDVQVTLTPLIKGARRVADYPVFKQGAGAQGGTVRRLVHVSLTFEHPTGGPFMLGSGRFVGLGLMRPVGEVGDVVYHLGEASSDG